MFKHRSDGVFAKQADPILGMTSHIMPHRYDAMVQFLLEERCEAMDAYIRKMGEKGIKLSYMHILMASIVRLYAEKPQLNRFVMNGRVFQRDGIYISFTVKKQLTEDSDETTIKMRFTGEEDLLTIKNMIDQRILENKGSSKTNDTDKTAKILTRIPNGLVKLTVNFLKFLDKHGCMPHKIIEVSPFHTGCFLTNMKSISTDYVYHHLYDFGTTGMFVGLGKEHLQPVVNEATNQIEIGKVIKIGVVIDERICDGFNYAKSIKLIRKFIRDPELLEEKYVIPECNKFYMPKQLRAMKRAQKKEHKRLLKAERLYAKQNS